MDESHKRELITQKKNASSFRKTCDLSKNFSKVQIMNSFLGNLIALLYCLATPVTFVYLLFNTDGWTWWNAIFLIGLCLIQASLWWVYWPLHFLLGW